MPDFAFRRVRAAADFAYCWPIYREAVAPLTTGWNEAAERRGIEQVLAEEGASILVEDKSDAGWLHVSESRFDIHLGYLFIEPERRSRGLGTRFLNWMSDRARRKGKTFTLDVLQGNQRARLLYERLGFRNQRTAGQRITMLLGN